MNSTMSQDETHCILFRQWQHGDVQSHSNTVGSVDVKRTL